MHAVQMRNVSRSWIGHSKALGYKIAVSKSAGGLKVKTLSQTPRDAGSSPAWHSNFSCFIKIALEKIIIYQYQLFLSRTILPTNIRGSNGQSTQPYSGQYIYGEF